MVAESIRGLSEMAKTLDEFKKSQEFFEDVKRKLEDGKEPDMEWAGSWKDLANSYRDSTRELRQMVPVTQFDIEPYQVSPIELFDETTRAGALERIRQYAMKLEAAAKKGRDSRVVLTQYQERLKAEDEVLRGLKKLYQEFLELGVGQLFGSEYDWYALHSYVIPDLAELRREVTKQMRTLDQEVSKIEKQIANLQGNLQLLELDRSTRNQPVTAQQPQIQDITVPDETATNAQSKSIENGWYVYKYEKKVLDPRSSNYGVVRPYDLRFMDIAQCQKSRQMKLDDLAFVRSRSQAEIDARWELQEKKHTLSTLTECTLTALD